MPDDYPSALANASSGTPLSPIEYASLVLGSNAQTLNSNTYPVDNSQGYWETKQNHGNTVVAATHPASQTVYFCHVNYVGPQQSTTMGALQLPAAQHAALAAAAGTTPENFAGWALIIAGAIIIAAVLLAPVTFGGSLLVLYAGYFFAVGLALIVLGAIDVVFTPSVVSHTCNADNSACCTITTSPTGQVNSCFNCTGAGCTSTTTTTGGIGSFLTQIAWGVGLIAVVGIGAYIALRVARAHRYGGRPVPPSAYSERGLSMGQRAGQAVRHGAEAAYHGTRGLVAGFHQGLRQPPPQV